jgi:hypothetical protein
MGIPPRLSEASEASEASDSPPRVSEAFRAPDASKIPKARGIPRRPDAPEVSPKPPETSGSLASIPFGSVREKRRGQRGKAGQPPDSGRVAPRSPPSFQGSLQFLQSQSRLEARV